MIEYDPSVTYSVPELAAHWHVDKRTVYSMIRNGTLVAFRCGSTYRITDKAVREHEEHGV